MQGTLSLAREIVEALTHRLSRRSIDKFHNIFSVYVSGSYVRGDFLDDNSDLDLSVVFKPGGDRLFLEDPSFRLIQSEVEDIIGGRSFASHDPGFTHGGVDWQPIRWDWLPTPERGPSFPGPGPYYPPFGIFLFDLHKHLKVCWGEDPRPCLVPPPNPVSMARASFERALERFDLQEAQGRERAASSAFKSIQLSQIVFGKLTLDKRRLPALYSNYVPDFPMKNDGARLIQEILKARYPHHPPQFAAPCHYKELVTQLWDLVRDEMSL